MNGESWVQSGFLTVAISSPIRFPCSVGCGERRAVPYFLLRLDSLRSPSSPSCCVVVFSPLGFSLAFACASDCSSSSEPVDEATARALSLSVQERSTLFWLVGTN